jgi:hypothetical protein
MADVSGETYEKGALGQTEKYKETDPLLYYGTRIAITTAAASTAGVVAIGGAPAVVGAAKVVGGAAVGAAKATGVAVVAGGKAAAAGGQVAAAWGYNQAVWWSCAGAYGSMLAAQKAWQFAQTHPGVVDVASGLVEGYIPDTGTPSFGGTPRDYGLVGGAAIRKLQEWLKNTGEQRPPR